MASKHSTYAVITRAQPPDYARYVIGSPWFLTSLAVLFVVGLMANALPWSMLSTALALTVAISAPLLPSIRRRIRNRLGQIERARLVAELDMARRADVAELDRLVAEVAAISSERATRLDRLLDGYVRAAVVERQLRMLVEATNRGGGDSDLARRRRSESARLGDRAGLVAGRMAHTAELMRLAHQSWLASTLGGEAERLGEIIVDEEHDLWDAIEGPIEVECSLLEAGRAP